MAKNTRLPAKRESDLALIEQMYLSGRSQADIGETVGLSQQMVAYEINKLRASWRTSQIRNWDEARNIEVAKLDALEQTYWQQFRASAAATGRGDMRCLAGILRVIDQRCKLLGLYAPVEIAAPSPDGNRSYDPITNSERAVSILRAVLEKHQLPSGQDDDEEPQAG